MKRFTVGLVFASVMVLVSTQVRADPVVFDFETGTVGTAIGSFYAAQGVTFSNAEFVSTGDFVPGSRVGFSGIDGPGPTSPIVVSFATPQTRVMVTGVDLSQQGMLLAAFSSNGTSLGTAGYLTGAQFGVPISFGSLTAVPQITYVDIFEPLNTRGTTGGALFDNLVLDTASGIAPTPEPVTLLLVASGLVLARPRRFRHAI